VTLFNRNQRKLDNQHVPSPQRLGKRIDMPQACYYEDEMKIQLVLVGLLLVAGAAYGQSACEQLGVDCSHPHVDSRPLCDESCRWENQRRQAEAQRRRDEEWEAGAPARAAERMRQEQEKYQNEQAKLMAHAQKLADKAWKLQQDDKNCDKVIELYTQALALYTFRPWIQNRAGCMSVLTHYDEAYAQWEMLINDPSTPDKLIPEFRHMEWSIMYFKGYVCPRPPRFNGLEGCTGRKDRTHLDTIYVPLPYIQGRDWRAKDVLSSGPYTVTTKDGHVYRSGEFNPTTVNLMDSHIQTGHKTVVQFVLPDDTIFSIGPEADLTIDDFVYDPNTNLTKMAAALTKGIFRFVTGKIVSHNPEILNSREIKLSVGSLGFRGTDIEMQFDDEDHLNRWWISAYDGDINLTTRSGVHHIPVGKTLFGMDTFERTLTLSDNTFPKANLSGTDHWEAEMTTRTSPAPGRQ
jgi:hypothetical protein